ncbi:MAG: methyltransferase domain-containing protein [Bacteroidota bacterium]
MLENRSTQAEIMDDLSCEGEVVSQTLRELNTINRFLGGNHLSIQGLEELTKGKENQIFTVADLGCGGGDILIKMAKWARKKGINMQFVGVDANPYITDYAQARCKDYPEISFQTLNVFESAFTKQQFDIIHSSLFTHHFDDQALTQLVAQFGRQARVGWIINDLHRHWLAYYSIMVLTRIFSRSKMVQFDSVVSVARGFKRKDWVQLFHQLQLNPTSIRWKWAFRWKIVYAI